MLSERSKQVRRDTFALSKANGGYHYGGCFSAVEILTALFDKVLSGEQRIEGIEYFAPGSTLSNKGR
jgi:transketolase N-terminal domain/subunit